MLILQCNTVCNMTYSASQNPGYKLLMEPQILALQKVKVLKTLFSLTHRHLLKERVYKLFVFYNDFHTDYLNYNLIVSLNKELISSEIHNIKILHI